LPPRYAPETPLVGLDVAFRAENGFLLQVTVDAALTRKEYHFSAIRYASPEAAIRYKIR
ncbi:DUF2715 domain-containing protein, partial [Treponema paraluiscuniculi]|uniref:DUF2715 domain-containing protein n=1 Tax=Treponema paraluiscuniculi TaxID=53435 RepID=UPI002FDBAD76